MLENKAVATSAGLAWHRRQGIPFRPQSVPEIDVSTTDDGDGCGAETAAEEAGDHYGGDVGGCCDGDLEDGEEEEAEEEGLGAAVDFGERTPDERACDKSISDLMTLCAGEGVHGTGYGRIYL